MEQIAGGEVDVDGSGVPLGIFRETAVTLITSSISEPNEEIRTQYYRTALHKCMAAGLTMVQTNDTNAWDLYKKLQEQGENDHRTLKPYSVSLFVSSYSLQWCHDPGELPIRVYLTIDHGEIGKGPRPGEHEGLLYCKRVKLFSDGSLGAETAALRQPYVGTENIGVLIHPLDELTEKVRLAHQEGYQLEIHAIGDRAMATVLDAYVGAGVAGSDRPIITHCQVTQLSALWSIFMYMR